MRVSSRITRIFLDAKVEGSINPGNQNFGSYKTITTYKFNNWLLNDFGNRTIG